VRGARGLQATVLAVQEPEPDMLPLFGDDSEADS
jgi:hypothetical protein